MLGHSPLFESLTEEEQRFLLDRSTSRTYTPGTVIFYEGEPSWFFYLVMEGELDIVKSLDSGDERVIKLVRAGEILGEMSLLHQTRNRTASARARSTVRMLEIPLSEFEEMLKRNAGLAYHLMQVMNRRLMETENETISELQEKNRQLTRSLQELEEAQEQLIAQERLDMELTMARKIQEAMLPQELPRLPGWELHALWQPARAVSGDFYDFIPLPDGRLALVVGDVTDKGVPAALIMTVTRSMLRTAAALAASPGDLLARVNTLLHPDMPESMFVTCFVGFLDPSTGQMSFANAGHCLPFHFHEGEVSELRAMGLPLGLMPDREYPGNETIILHGDRLLFYSDGLVEAHNEQGKMFGKDSVLAFFHGCVAGSATIEDLLRHQEKFRGEGEQEDDITLVCLSREEKLA